MSSPLPAAPTATGAEIGPDSWTGSKANSPPVLHHWAFKPKLKKAAETKFMVEKKGKSLGVLLLAGVQWHQVHESELGDRDEQTRAQWRCARARCGASAAAFLQLSQAGSQRTRWGPQGTVKIITPSSVSSCSRSPPVACSGWGPGDRCWLCGTADIVTLGSGCSWSLRALPEGCRGGTAPSPAQTSSTRLYLQKKGPHTKGRREEREHDQPRCVSLQLLNLSFLPLKTSQDNSWHVSSAFSISSRSLALGALLVHGAAVPAAGTQLHGGRGGREWGHGWEWGRDGRVFLVQTCGGGRAAGNH